MHAFQFQPWMIPLGAFWVLMVTGAFFPLTTDNKLAYNSDVSKARQTHDNLSWWQKPSVVVAVCSSVAVVVLTLFGFLLQQVSRSQDLSIQLAADKAALSEKNTTIERLSTALTHVESGSASNFAAYTNWMSKQWFLHKNKSGGYWPGEGGDTNTENISGVGAAPFGTNGQYHLVVPGK